MNLNIVIPIDDTHPEAGWGIKEDVSTNLLIKLNEEFGCKFVQFIPSNYHNKYPLSEHSEWVNFWKQFSWIELAGHGHLHMRTVIDPGCRECEFVELNYQTAKQRLADSLKEWEKVGVRPKGWRMPGWLATQGSFDAVKEYFDYVAIHESINSNINLSGIKVFKGANSIASTDSLTLDNTNLYFQSHIAGVYNSNNWNVDNYEHFRLILNSLLEQGYTLNFKTFSDLL